MSCFAVVSLPNVYVSDPQYRYTAVCTLLSCASAGNCAGSLSLHTNLSQCHSQVPTRRTRYNFLYALHGQRKSWSKNWIGDLALHRKIGKVWLKIVQGGTPIWHLLCQNTRGECRFKFVIFVRDHEFTRFKCSLNWSLHVTCTWCIADDGFMKISCSMLYYESVDIRLLPKLLAYYLKFLQ